ncbi:MAG TPA: glycosyltransferase [Ignavibacteria bacterium]|nr:glycosyltransferase [Ignavibacteria bacterium]
MENLLIRIIEKLFIVYFVGYFFIDLILFFIFLYFFNSDKKKYEVGIELNEFYKKASIIVPAYNEEVSIIHCIDMLYKLDYPDFEIIIVNDGSSDNTLMTLLRMFSFEISGNQTVKNINTADVRSVYNCDNGKIILIDKVNGGKADSINAGINYSTGDFICTVDADSILDEGSLKKVILPMLIDRRVFVTGGQIAISNDTVIENNKIVNFKMPHNILVLWQITEYIKSFLVSRIGLSKLNSLLIMSGAFSVYRRKDLINIGGFLTLRNNHDYLRQIFKTKKETVCEDMEIVVRLWRYYHENNLPGRVVYLAKPLCWTEAPDNLKNLYKQRSRWHLGLAECLYMHSKMLFAPEYYSTGLLAFPYYFFFELFSPLIKLTAFAFIIYVSLQGLLNLSWVLLMVLFITLTSGLITSITTVIIERWSEKQAVRNRDALRYKSFTDWLKLLSISIIGDFSYSFFKIFAQFKGLLDFTRQKSEWNKFERKGIQRVVSPAAKSN